MRIPEMQNRRGNRLFFVGENFGRDLVKTGVLVKTGFFGPVNVVGNVVQSGFDFQHFQKIVICGF